MTLPPAVVGFWYTDTRVSFTRDGEPGPRRTPALCVGGEAWTGDRSPAGHLPPRATTRPADVFPQGSAACHDLADPALVDSVDVIADLVGFELGDHPGDDA